MLFATDVLSEGVNLQQAGHIISVDLPWNPMRLVQRHGRIDRIGSHHRFIGIDCFFPAKNLDRLLRLEERLQRKIAYANAAIGMGEVLPGQLADPTIEVALNDLRQQIDDIHDEKTELFETRRRLGRPVRRGVPPPAREGDGRPAHESRRDRTPLRSRQRLRLDKDQGSRLGVLRPDRRPPATVVPVRRRRPRLDAVDPRETAAMPWIIDDTLTSLVAADPGDRDTEQHLPDGAAEGVFDAWAHAHDHIYSAWTRLTDVANLQPDIPLALREAAELVANHGSYLGIEKQQGLAATAQREMGEADRRPRTRDRALGGDCDRARSRSSSSSSPTLASSHRAAEPLPVIERDDVRLVCWMAVTASS